MDGNVGIIFVSFPDKLGAINKVIYIIANYKVVIKLFLIIFQWKLPVYVDKDVLSKFLVKVVKIFTLFSYLGLTNLFSSLIFCSIRFFIHFDVISSIYPYSYFCPSSSVL